MITVLNCYIIQGISVKQMTGIEPASPAWEAGVLPMNYICDRLYYSTYITAVQYDFTFFPY